MYLIHLIIGEQVSEIISEFLYLSYVKSKFEFLMFHAVQKNSLLFLFLFKFVCSYIGYK